MPHTDNPESEIYGRYLSYTKSVMCYRREYVLSYRCCVAAGSISPDDTMSLTIVSIDMLEAGRRRRDELHRRAFEQRCITVRHATYHEHICVRDALTGDFFRR